jgi:hypothetical protein
VTNNQRAVAGYSAQPEPSTKEPEMDTPTVIRQAITDLSTSLHYHRIELARMECATHDMREHIAREHHAIQQLQRNLKVIEQHGN